jgi:hypothetical protein
MPAQTAGRQQYLALSQAIRQHGVRQPCDVIGHIAATISFGAYGNDVPAISQPSLVMRRPARRRRGGHDRVRGRPLLQHRPVYRLQRGHLRHSWYFYVRLR